MKILTLLFLVFLVSFAHDGLALESLQADIRIHRSFVVWNGLRASIQQEEICRKTLPLPLTDRREESERNPVEGNPLTFSCPTYYKEKPVTATVTGVWEWVNAENFTAALPKEHPLNRIYFNLQIETKPDFPYLSKLQNMAIFQVLGEDLEKPRPFIFALSTESYVVVTCSQIGCEVPGPEATYRVEVRIFNNQ